MSTVPYATSELNECKWDVTSPQNPEAVYHIISLTRSLSERLLYKPHEYLHTAETQAVPNLPLFYDMFETCLEAACTHFPQSLQVLFCMLSVKYRRK